MPASNSRKYPRCQSTTAVTISFLNQSSTYEGVARNYSRGGMYIESPKALRPGTMIQIRPVGCEALDDPRSSKPYYCNDTIPDEPECRQLKMLVVGEVKRCDELGTAATARYGLAVRYVSPAV